MKTTGICTEPMGAGRSSGIRPRADRKIGCHLTQALETELGGGGAVFADAAATGQPPSRLPCMLASVQAKEPTLTVIRSAARRLAKTGLYSDPSEMRAALEAEGYERARGALRGAATRRWLKDLIEQAKASASRARRSSATHVYQTELWSVELPAGWRAKEDAECTTITGEEIDSALQISVATKESGAVSGDDIRDISADSIGKAKNRALLKIGKLLGVYAERIEDSTFWREWWLRNGNHLFYITYNAPEIHKNIELGIIDSIVKSLKLAPTAAAQR